ncbi:MAG: Lipoprotein-releasing system transmembrane protein LolC [Turneriella sp.]|nr:Lipoprotein-releasing system transmembrane protein LolC [Turneriella sp.]
MKKKHRLERIKLALGISYRYARGKSKYFLSMNAFLAFVGVFVGTSLLVVVMSIFGGFQAQLKKSIFQFDPHVMLSVDRVTGGEKILGWQKWKERLAIDLAGDIESVEGSIQSPAIFRKRKFLDHVFVRGMDFEFDKATHTFKLPAYFPEIVEPKNSRSIPQGDFAIVGKEMAANLGLSVGDTIELIVPRGQFSLQTGVTPSIRAFKIAGLFKTGHYTYDTKVVVLSLETAQNLYALPDAVQQIVLRLKDTDALPKLRKKIGHAWPYTVRTIEDEQRNFFAALRLEKTIMIVIVFLFIIAAMVGIIIATFNIVRAHRRDIGIMKSLGFSSRQILIIFAITGLAMGVIGSIAGIFAGVGLANNLESILRGIEAVINVFGNLWCAKVTQCVWLDVRLIPRDVYYFDHLPIDIDWKLLRILGYVSVSLSILASIIPARKAAKLEPIDIIRKAEF